MAEDDRVRWDERYAEGDWADADEPARILEDAEAWLVEPGLALDVACGAGRNALWLARHGFKVIAVDISWDENFDIQLVHADLESFALPPDTFDLIINSRFLLRPLFATFRNALKPGGLLLAETFTVDEIDVLGGDIRRAYALERGELRQVFGDFEILLYEEGVFEEAEGERGLARMVARRPAGSISISNNG
jgi:SAM-dependent methyltransferase